MEDHPELMPLLTVTGGTMRGLSFRVGRDPQVIGRAPTAGIVLDDPHLSRRHAAVQLTGEGVSLTDLGSTNGTWLNDRRITGVELLDRRRRDPAGPYRTALLRPWRGPHRPGRAEPSARRGATIARPCRCRSRRHRWPPRSRAAPPCRSPRRPSTPTAEPGPRPAHRPMGRGVGRHPWTGAARRASMRGWRARSRPCRRTASPRRSGWPVRRTACRCCWCTATAPPRPSGSRCPAAAGDAAGGRPRPAGVRRHADRAGGRHPGLTDFADDVAALLDGPGCSPPGARPVVVGHSLGGGRGDAAAGRPPRAGGRAAAGGAGLPVRLRRHPGPPRHPHHARLRRHRRRHGANPDFVARLAAGDRGADGPTSPRAVLRATYVADPASLGEDEELLLDSVLSTATGDDNYPGTAVASAHWPGTAPGERGVLNALAPAHFRLADELVAVAGQAAGHLGTRRRRRDRLGHLAVRPGVPGVARRWCPAGRGRRTARRSR